MKVLLINPKFPDTYWSFSHALPFEGKRSAFPPLGLLTVSALLPFSWERRLVDMNVESLKASAKKMGHQAGANAYVIKPDVSHLLGVFSFESPVSLDPLAPELEGAKPRGEGAKDEQHAEGHKKNGKPQNEK